MRACITGYGIVDCLGNNPSENFVKLIDSNEYSSEIDYSFIRHAYVKRAATVNASTDISIPNNHLSKTILYGIYATEQAMKMANVTDTKNVAVILSSVTGGNELRWEAQQAQHADKRYPLKKSLNIMIDSLCSIVSQSYGFTGVNTSIYSACATGIMTIDYGMKLLDEYDYVIVGGADNGVNEIDLGFFGSLTALAEKSCPFDDKRKGFMMGSGAGVLILESEEKAIARGATIHAYVYPSGNASDAHDRTAPSGHGAILAMQKAIKFAGNPEIDFVNAHGTSTPAGDEVEYNSIIKTLGDVHIYSNKGKIGHTMAAAGVIETIYSIEAMKNHIIPHTHNLETSSFDVNNNLVKKPIMYDKKVSRTLNNSFGFGGKCSSMVIEYVN